VRRANVVVKTLRDMRWQVFWYGVGFALLVMLIVYIYPSYRDQLAGFQIPEAMKAFVGENADFGTPEGYFSAELFSWIPLLFVVFAIMQGTNLLGGEEATGTADILLAQPISRSSLLLQKLGAFVIGSVAIVGIEMLGWLLSLPFVSIDISYGRLVLATVNMLPLVFLFGALGMWLSAALSGRQAASGITTAVAVAAYVLNYLATLVDVMRPFRLVSPFFYGNTANVLTAGLDWAKLAVMAVVTLAFVLMSLRAFDRRDIGVRSAGPRLPYFRRHAAPA
jgi:ABC-2 type transport system permease protein